jgi:uncharacterized protein
MSNAPDATTHAAGPFARWLRDAEAALRPDGEADVPCGSCTACCRSSMFVHIAPDETRTLKRIPRALLFPAPGRPAGHVLMGYDDHGRCPMLVGDQCSIYEDRPQTCRRYDCRVLAATGVPVDAKTQPDIAARVKSWVFQYEDPQSRQEQDGLAQAAAFLQGHADLFPPGWVPEQPAQVAALAVRIHRAYVSLVAMTGAGGEALPASEIARAITAAAGGLRDGS